MRTSRVAIMVIVGITGLSGATAASAATGWDRCPVHYSCYFNGVNGQGPMWKAPSAGWFDLPFQVISDWNRGNGTVDFYRGTQYTKYSSPVGYKGSNGALDATSIHIHG